jgi:glycosyltransferase involved in cell wall biosynthesis
MISIIMPVWNGARFMDRAIASVVAQTSPAWELVIVDDGSEDDSLERAHRWRELVNRHYGEEKIVVLSSGGSNSGAAVPTNLGAEKAQHDILTHLHMDDLLFPRRIESLLSLFDRFDLVFAPYEIFEEDRLKLWNPQEFWRRSSSECSSTGDREPSYSRWMQSWLQRRNVSVPLGVAHSRQIFGEVGGFQAGILAATEGVAWRRMADRGARIGFCPIVAGRYNVRTDSQARTKKPFSTGGFELQRDHPMGSNGQYLDAQWYADLEWERRRFGTSS